LILEVSAAEAQTRQPPVFDIYRWRGEVEFEFAYDYDKRTNNEQPDVTVNEFLFRETISIGADSWVYHPSFIRLFSDVGLVFNQDRQETDPGSENSDVDGLLVNFDFLASILPEKPYPMTAFAGQSHSEINSPFAQRRTVDTLRYGGGLHLRELSFGPYEAPTRLSYRHIETDTNGSFGNNTTQDRLDLSMRSKTISTRNRLLYQFQNRESKSSGNSRTSKRHDLRAYQDWELDRGGRLTSQFVFTDQADDFSVQTVALNENLLLEHSGTWRSHYGYSLNYQDNGGTEQVSNAGSIGVSHRLYDSLDSSLTGTASYSDSDFGQTLNAKGAGSLHYTKSIPAGTLGLRFLPSYAYEDDDADAAVLNAINELHPVRLGQLIILDRNFVIRSTIVVTDAATGFLFVEGIDYDVIDLDPRTGLEIIPGSSLDPGVPPFTTSVSVDYQYDRLPSRTFTTLAVATGINLHLWDHFSLDVSYSQTEQKLLDGEVADNTLDDTKRLFAYIDAVFEHNRTRIEYERVRADITPRERVRASHNINFRPTDRSTIGAGVVYSYDRLTDTNRVTNFWGVNANGTSWMPFDVLGRVNLFFRALDQEEQDSISVGSTIVFTYHYGRLEFELSDRLSWNRIEASSGREQRTTEILNTVYFRISRPF
jgi:hypothetical protein